MDSSTIQASSPGTESNMHTGMHMTESSALMALVSSKSTHIAKQSGSWFDPNTWQGRRVPKGKAKVVIPSEISVNYDGRDDARLHTLKVDGELTFATRQDTKMVVDTFVVSASGRLEIGTEDNPVRTGVKTEIVIADNGEIDLKWDPTQLSRGLLSHGAVQIHGEVKTSHLKVQSDPMAGDRTLILQTEPINWQVGDTLVLTGTHYNRVKNDEKWEATNEDEEVTIEAIDGNVITLAEPLTYNHETPRSDLKAYVSNISRNVVIASENGDRLPVGQRGHTLFMHSDAVDIRYAEFKGLGRTDKSERLDKIIDGRANIAGRYAAHIHRTGVGGNPAVLIGNTVDGSPGWGFVIHDSSAILQNNVAYDINGAAFVTESGNETGAFRNNISVKTGGIFNHNEKKGVDTHDFGRSGVGFWFAGRLMENEGNVAAGSRNAGMFYLHRGSQLIRPTPDLLPIPDAARNRDKAGTVTVDQAPIQGFKDNEVLASSVGLHIVKDFPRQSNDLRTVLDGFKGWEVEEGTHLQYTAHYTLNDFDLVGSQSARLWRNKGLVMQPNLQEIVFNNMSIDGFDTGIVSGRSDPGRRVPPLSERGLIWIDLEIKNTSNNFKNFKLPPEKWLTSAALKPGQLKFELSDASDLEIEKDDVGDYITIRGTKTDSLGTIKMPFGNEKLSLNYQDVSVLAQKGYYTLADGRRAAIIEEYISDRVTGDIIKLPIVVTFKEGWWTKDSPNLGVLDPSSLGGAQKVTIPRGESFPRIESKPFVEPLIEPVVEVEPVVEIAEEFVSPVRLWSEVDPLLGAGEKQQPQPGHTGHGLHGDVWSDVLSDVLSDDLGDWIKQQADQEALEMLSPFQLRGKISQKLTSQQWNHSNRIAFGSALKRAFDQTQFQKGVGPDSPLFSDALDDAKHLAL